MLIPGHTTNYRSSHNSVRGTGMYHWVGGCAFQCSCTHTAYTFYTQIYHHRFPRHRLGQIYCEKKNQNLITFGSKFYTLGYCSSWLGRVRGALETFPSSSYACHPFLTVLASSRHIPFGFTFRQCRDREVQGDKGNTHEIVPIPIVLPMHTQMTWGDWYMVRCDLMRILT